jgi:hypothetical protein
VTLRFIISTLALALLGSAACPAQLDALDQEPWYSFHTVYSDNRSAIGVTREGTIRILPATRREETIHPNLGLTISIVIEDKLANGREIRRTIRRESLKASTPPTAEPTKLTITGETSAAARFELNLEQSDDEVLVKARLTDRGKLVSPDARFFLLVTVPSLYPWNSSGEKESRNFERKVADDRVDLVRSDGKKVRVKGGKGIDLESADASGPGLAGISMEFAAHRGRKILLKAAEGSTLHGSNPANSPLHEGFELRWAPDPAKDPEGKATLGIEVR